jgi:hypothetical protein
MIDERLDGALKVTERILMRIKAKLIFMDG